MTTRLLYQRNGTEVEVIVHEMSNHELREVLVGLWATMDAEDRADHIGELTHYRNTPSSWLSPVARAICDGGVNKGWRRKPEPS